MNALAGIAISTVLVTAVGCAQMRPSETAREAPASEPAGDSLIMRGEQAPPSPEQVPALPPDAGASDFKL